MRRTQLSAGILAGVALLIGAGCEMMRFPAQTRLPPPAIPESTDPPARVARVSYVQDSVSFRAGGTEGWAPALLNRPLTDGDELWTQDRTRAELDLGSAAIRLDSHTYFDILDLDDRSAQFKITQGIIGVWLRRLDAGDTFEIDTPNAAITLLRPGNYRIEVHAGEELTSITVLEGLAHVADTTQTFTVFAPQQARVAGADGGVYKIVPPAGPDAFDEFSQTRDRCEEAAQTARYVSPDVIGYYDLDEFGAWQVDPVWGPVWTPRNLPAGWAPFRFGRWLWIEPWGWTWLDDAAWGFAPFHYGRWAFLDGRWRWLPGPRHVRPVYAPALVMFTAGGNRGSRDFLWMGRPEVAWFPLGPGEVYVPPYRCTHGYLTDINITNTTIANPLGLPAVDVVRQKYQNQAVPGAMTAVAGETFAGGGSIGRAALVVPPRTLMLAKVTGTSAPAAPTLFSVSPGVGSTTPRPAEADRDRQVLVWRVPAPAPVPFERAEALRKGQPGRPLDRAILDDLRRAQPSPGLRPVQPAGLSRPGKEDPLMPERRSE